jgi:HD-GYP domain-containing protein (c-di-GMP phosphodiesterase class II)
VTEDETGTKVPRDRGPGAPADSRELQKAAVDLLIRFHIVIKNARLYEPNNAMFRDQVKSLFAALEPILRRDGGASFRVRQSALFLNGQRLKIVLGTYPIFKSVLEEFRNRDIGALAFEPGLSVEELVRFVSAFSAREQSEEEPFEKLLADIDAAGIDDVRIERTSAKETFSSLNRDTTRIFFLSIVHLKESFERNQHDEKLKVNTTRRLMQSILNHIVDNESFVCGLTNLKNYDEYTLNHSVNVCMLSLALGRRLGLSRSELIELGMSAFFHDLGKLDTPLDILNKPAGLTSEEREIMERHPHQGAEKLLHLREFKRLPLRAVHVALEHHIKEDLSGYPRYFKKDDVNLFSKIVKVADYFDAVTTKRVYRKKVFTRAEALSLMLEQSGTEFNPIILKAFVNLMGAYPIGTMVALDSGELGIVFDLNPNLKFMLRPKVKLITDAAGNKVDGEIVDLTERLPARNNRYLKTIVKPLDPDAYGVEVADYFLARGQ